MRRFKLLGFTICAAGLLFLIDTIIYYFLVGYTAIGPVSALGVLLTRVVITIVLFWLGLRFLVKYRQEVG